MITYKKGDLLEAKGVIVHGCNAQGAYGSGVAGQIRKKWPRCYEDYTNLINFYGKDNTVSLGQWAWTKPERDVLVVNMITQRYYGYDGKQYVCYEAIEYGFRNLVDWILYSNKPKVINFPKIGCGLAGGDWRSVSEIINRVVPDDFEKVCWELE